jgi:hypothetical protein
MRLDAARLSCAWTRQYFLSIALRAEDLFQRLESKQLPRAYESHALTN